MPREKEKETKMTGKTTHMSPPPPPHRVCRQTDNHSILIKSMASASTSVPSPSLFMTAHFFGLAQPGLGGGHRGCDEERNHPTRRHSQTNNKKRGSGTNPASKKKRWAAHPLARLALGARPLAVAQLAALLGFGLRQAHAKAQALCNGRLEALALLLCASDHGQGVLCV